MAQNQPSRAIAVIPSDTINIPVPGIITSGTAAAPGTTLTDGGQDFLNSATNANGYNITGGELIWSDVVPKTIWSSAIFVSLWL